MPELDISVFGYKGELQTHKESSRLDREYTNGRTGYDKGEGVNKAMTKDKKTKRARYTTSIAASKEAAANLKTIARRLYEDAPEEHEKIGVHIPSTRVAIDYLLAAAIEEDDNYATGLKTNNNLWLQMTGRIPEAV